MKGSFTQSEGFTETDHIWNVVNKKNEFAQKKCILRKKNLFNMNMLEKTETPIVPKLNLAWRRELAPLKVKEEEEHLKHVVLKEAATCQKQAAENREKDRW